MLIGLLLAAQIAQVDSIYATPALRALVDSVAATNRYVPAALLGYRARMQTEMAIVQRGSDQLEGIASVEQVAVDVTWRRTGTFDQRVVGYRARSATYTGASIYQLSTWSVPVLYGDNFQLFFGPDTVRQRERGEEIRNPEYLHPFAAGRDAIYRYKGGDTVAVIRTAAAAARAIPIVRILVDPVIPRREISLFRGEIDVDATTKQIVRMRGELLDVMPPSVGERIGRLLVSAAGYVELVNQEIAGAYWLPTYQRIDFQVSSPMMGRAGLILRFQTRFAGFVLDTLATAASVVAADTMVPQGRKHTSAPADSVRAFKDWQFELGDPTAGVRAEDFWTEEIGKSVFLASPAEARGRVVWRATRARDVFHFNRIEGAFTGYGVGVPLPYGGSLQLDAGWAWAEETARGSATARWTLGEGRATYELFAGRSLDHTNDFRRPYERGGTFRSLFHGRDYFDYLDRRQAGVAWAAQLFRGTTRIRMELGAASDRRVTQHVTHALVQVDTAALARPNRGIREGDYARMGLRFEYHPELQGRFVGVGTSASIASEIATGDLSWHRLEARLRRRSIFDRLVLDGSMEGGWLLGLNPPPQQIFELGGEPRLPDHEYKAYGGDRAWVGDLRVFYRLPFFETPRGQGRRRRPGLSPALALETNAGWATYRGTTRATMLELGAPTDSIMGIPQPISRATNGIVSSVRVGLRVFGEALFVGQVKVLKPDEPWRPRVELTSTLW